MRKPWKRRRRYTRIYYVCELGVSIDSESPQEVKFVSEALSNRWPCYTGDIQLNNREDESNKCYIEPMTHIDHSYLLFTRQRLRISLLPVAVSRTRSLLSLCFVILRNFSTEKLKNNWNKNSFTSRCVKRYSLENKL